MAQIHVLDKTLLHGCAKCALAETSSNGQRYCEISKKNVTRFVGAVKRPSFCPLSLLASFVEYIETH